MIKKLLLTTALATSILPATSFGVSDADFAGIRGTMASIKDAMTVAIYTAENTYEQQGGTGIAAEIDLKAGDNKYIDTLKLQPGYIISLKFPTARGDASKLTDGKVPVTQALLGKEIKLVPVYAEGDEVITSWECLTDADKDVQHFMGSAGTPEYNASFIREYTTMPQLSLCIYVSDLSAVVGDSGGGDSGAPATLTIGDNTTVGTYTYGSATVYSPGSDDDYMTKALVFENVAMPSEVVQSGSSFIIATDLQSLNIEVDIEVKSDATRDINTIKQDLTDILNQYTNANTGNTIYANNLLHASQPQVLKNEFNAYFKWLSDQQ